MTERSIQLGMICLSVIGFGQAFSELRAVELRRGPFLQMASPDSITIRWRTDVAGASVVHYGTQAGALNFGTANLNPTTEHEVRLGNLQPATRYFYSVGSLSQRLVEGTNCSFVTFPPAGQAQPTRVWVVGDAGQSYDFNQRSVRDAYAAYTGPRHTDVLLALGDNGLVWGTDEEYQTYFFDVFADLLRQTALWPTIGNHETWGTAPGGRIPYLDIFSLPTNGESGGVPSGREEYYSFDHANIHFICLDSATQSRATNGLMADWLRADLAATTNQWIIAYWHHAPYSFGLHWSDDPSEVEMIEMRRNIMPILEAGGVDLVLNGHAHIYERSYLLRGHYGFSGSLRPEMFLDLGSGREDDTGAYIKATSGPLANQGTVYVEVGSSASVDLDAGHYPAMFHTELQLGSLVLDVSSNRLDAVFLRETGAIHDSFTILKGEPAPLRLCRLIKNGEKTVVRWKSIPGRVYLVECADNLGIAGWQPASNPITALGFTTFWTNSPTSVPVQLYRVVQLSQP